MRQLKNKSDRESANSVLEVFFRENRELAETMMEDDSMSEALLEIMEPKIMELMEPKIMEIQCQARSEGVREGIKGSVSVLRALGHGDTEIRTAIMAQYHLSNEEANEYL